jgi:hypothetical protein
MSRSIRRLGAGVAVSLAGVAAFGAGSAAAAASPAESATANFVSGPFHVQFNAQRAANAPVTAATGSFLAHTTLGTTNLVTLAGPVTCLDVRGNEMGLFYPVASSSPSLLGSLVKGVFIYVTVNATTGKPMSVNFAPTASSTATSCAPLPGIAPITSGTVTLTS